jgi:uncharacterized protein (DUF1697 family)
VTTHLAFLRAINLGATRKFPAAEVRQVVENVGGTQVASYINTGNIRFEHAEQDQKHIKGLLEQAFAANRGFEVPTLVFSPSELGQIAQDAAMLDTRHPWAERHYVYLLDASADAQNVAALTERCRPELELFVTEGRAGHLLMTGSADFRSTRFGINVVEKQLGLATNRNVTVIRTLHKNWCS